MFKRPINDLDKDKEDQDFFKRGFFQINEMDSYIFTAFCLW